MTRDAWYIILNPVAGTGSGGKQWPEMERLFKDCGFNFVMERTTQKGGASLLAREAVLAGYRKIITIGGDGTNNETINGIFSQDKVPPSDLIYTLVPVGTGNDWVKTHGIPTRFKKWIPEIKRENTIWQDMGHVTYRGLDGGEYGRYFANVAGLAYDGHVTKLTNERGEASVGKFIYLYLALSQLMGYRNKKAAVVFNDTRFEGEFYSINVGICRYSGGGMQLVPHARPDDGLLALTYDTGLSKWDVVGITPRLFRGNVHRHPKVRACQVERVCVEPLETAPTYLEVDGEFLGQAPCEFSIVKRAIRIIVP